MSKLDDGTENDITYMNSLNLYNTILKNKSFVLRKEHKILEVGSGRGDLLKAYLNKGFNIYGTDIVSYGYDVREDCKHVFSPIDESTYKFPFEADSFDVVISSQVVEHVQNHQDFFSEISRVLKKGGVSIHIFPSKYRPIEPHINVPFGAVFKNYYYYLFFARLKVYQLPLDLEKSPSEIASRNFDLIMKRTNYIPRKKLHKTLSSLFVSVEHIENLFIMNSKGRASISLSRWIKIIPALVWLYSIFHTQVIYTKK